MDELKDLLAGRLPEEPPEIRALQRYVREQFNSHAVVAIREGEVELRVPSAALANALRLRTQALQRLCPPGKRLTIRIGR